MVFYEPKNMLELNGLKEKPSPKNYVFEEVKQSMFKLARDKNHKNSQSQSVQDFQSELDKMPKSDALLKAKDTRGNTALHYAAKAGNLEVCKLLYSEGKGVDIDVRGQNKMTPLQFAARYGDANRAKDVWSCMEWIRKVYDEKHTAAAVRKQNMTESFDLKDKEKDKYNFNLLHHAIQNTNTEANPYVVSELLKSKQFSIRDTDKQGNTSLHLAAQFDRGKKDKVLDIFIEANNKGSISNDDLLHCIEKTNKIGQTPIHIACAVGNAESLRQLVEAGKDLRCDIRTTSGNEMKKILNSPDNDDSYPLHLAIESNNLEMIDILMGEGAKLSEQAITCAARLGISYKDFYFCLLFQDWQCDHSRETEEDKVQPEQGS